MVFYRGCGFKGLGMGGLGVFCSFYRTSFRSSWYFIGDVVLKVWGWEDLKH